jgi:phosphotriesterase-related protein
LGVVRTVLADIAPEELGVTMTHEHLLVDFRYLFAEPADSATRALAYAPIALEHHGWIRFNWNVSYENLSLLDVDLAVAELGRFARAGGRSVVDATSLGIGRDPAGLARIARATGLHVIMGSGHYLKETHPPEMAGRPVGSIADEIERDVTMGVGESSVRAGIIGEIGCSWPWHPNEQKALQAAVIAQTRTGAPLMIHPPRHEPAPLEIVRAVRAWGGDPTRTIMCHVDRTFHDRRALGELAATGVYLELDLFGHELSHYPFNPRGYMPSDGQRVEQIAWLLDQGYGARILISHDICFKHRLARYGGHGYDHVLINVVPRMRNLGIADDVITRILVENPAQAFAFDSPSE